LKVEAIPSGTAGASGPAARDRRVLTLDDNHVASAVFGQFNQNIALIEQRLGIEAVTHGNHVTLNGGPAECEMAAQVLRALEGQAEKAGLVSLGDVDGAIRLAQSAVKAATQPTGDDAPPPPDGHKAEAARKPVADALKNAAAINTRKRSIRARTRNQDGYIRALGQYEMVFAIGPAGTGKTYLAVAHAAALLEKGIVDRIVLSRPAVEAGERLGFLPGDMKDKVDPYLRPLYDALYDVLPADRVEKDITSGVIEIAPLAFMRGRTLANAIVILDEAQNTTTMQMKMFLTRLGENGRMVVTGDPSQIDLPRGQRSGLVEALQVLDGVEGIHQTHFSEVDVVRHPLVARIVSAYDKADTAIGRSDYGTP